MLKVEFGERQTDTKEYKTTIVINNIADDEAYFFSSKDQYKSATLFNDEAVAELVKHSFNEVSGYFSKFEFYQDVDWWDEYLTINVYCGPHYHVESLLIRIELELEPEHWINPWSIAEFAESLEQAITGHNSERVKYYQDSEEFVSNGFGIDVFIDSIESIISGELNYALQFLEILVFETNRRLQESVNADSISIPFNIQPELRSPFKQYLVYFAQFLADIGIEADTELKKEANQTLFTVSPVNGEEALSRIREALVIYLDAPYNPAFQIQTVGYNDPAVIQWKANVLHLESQLMLATATIQAKDAAIEALKLSNFQYNQLLIGKKEEKKGEEILDGLVTVKEYEGPGFSVDMAEILRRLKRKFIKDA